MRVFISQLVGRAGERPRVYNQIASPHLSLEDVGAIMTTKATLNCDEPDKVAEVI